LFSFLWVLATGLRCLGCLPRCKSIFAPFNASLGTSTYNFRVIKASTKVGKYSDIMVKDCKAVGMKPVCEAKQWCSDKSVFIGQSGRMSSNQARSSYFPSGWEKISKAFKGLCFYAAIGYYDEAFCNYPTNSYSLRTPEQTSNFMCAARAPFEASPFEASFGAKNGVEARTYRFQAVEASTTDGTFADIMVQDCKAMGMKPVCDYSSWCSSDKSAIYIGQRTYMSHGRYQQISYYFPSGWKDVSGKFEGLCFYPGSRGKYGRAFCSSSKYHSWVRPTKTSRFMCATIVK